MSTNTFHLILHVDINKTCVMKDVGKPTSLLLSSLLSEQAWGHIDKTKTPPTFNLVSTGPSETPPGDGMHTYCEYLEDYIYKYRTGQEEDVQEYNNNARTTRRKLKLYFTESNIGKDFRSYHNELLRHLKLPNEMKKKAEESSELFQDGNYFLLPSFLNLLVYLRNQKEYTYSIVFRTFGPDATDVLKECEMLATGKHPLYEGISFKELKVKDPEQVLCAFYRTGQSPDESFLFLNTGEVDSKQPHPREHTISGFTNIYEYLKQRLVHKKESILAIRDYHPLWQRNQENHLSGKLLLLNSNDIDIKQIFLDDNIERDHLHILDPRDISSQCNDNNVDNDNTQYITLEKGSGKVFNRINPYEAIVNPQYYVNLIQQCIAASSS